MSTTLLLSMYHDPRSTSFYIRPYFSCTWIYFASSRYFSFPLPVLVFHFLHFSCFCVTALHLPRNNRATPLSAFHTCSFIQCTTSNHSVHTSIYTYHASHPVFHFFHSYSPSVSTAFLLAYILLYYPNHLPLQSILLSFFRPLSPSIFPQMF